jgi:hypothetical protein
VLGCVLRDLARFGALSPAPPVIWGRPLWNSVDSPEFLGWDDLHHATQPVQDRHGRSVPLIVD